MIYTYYSVTLWHQVNSTIYCGRTASEHQCPIATDGTSCEPPSVDQTCNVAFILPTYEPTSSPIPTENPSRYPTINPTNHPSDRPTLHPSAYPTHDPSRDPSSIPTANTNAPSAMPTQIVAVTLHPTRHFRLSSTTVRSTNNPTVEPTLEPTKEPTKKPTKSPTTVTGISVSQIPAFSTYSNHPTAEPTSLPSTTATKPMQVTNSVNENFWNAPYGYDLKFVLVGVCAILLFCCVLLCICFCVRRQKIEREAQKTSAISLQPLLLSENMKDNEQAHNSEQISEPGATLWTPMQDDNVQTKRKERRSVAMSEHKEMDEGDMEIEDMFNGDSINDNKTPSNPAEVKRNERESIAMHVHDTDGKRNKTSVSVVGNVRDTDL